MLLFVICELIVLRKCRVPFLLESTLRLFSVQILLLLEITHILHILLHRLYRIIANLPLNAITLLLVCVFQ